MASCVDTTLSNTMPSGRSSELVPELVEVKVVIPPRAVPCWQGSGVDQDAQQGRDHREEEGTGREDRDP
jgi:hypothetical protein